jgi:hypothetical protein
MDIDADGICWHKSTHSNSASNCVEVAWVTSSHSASNQNCVQAAKGGDAVLVRDSKDPEGPVLRFTPSEWDAFVGGVRNGEFNFA